ncbi:hypothetical protein WOLCODRAFT_18223 [Wolfiporia cocos MD-104 SS10]|uniref:Uncharacterized protein n=1 Tax=Wolfiporia cocos (strain MD-104) TaxID=742152 RepID=A0A2H3JLX7_WOLCO|nr:hypothetical protein WOLCODRAFT_18223 [Wolfiporia cocos MD-104 SS10]
MRNFQTHKQGTYHTKRTTTALSRNIWWLHILVPIKDTCIAFHDTALLGTLKFPNNIEMKDVTIYVYGDPCGGPHITTSKERPKLTDQMRLSNVHTSTINVRSLNVPAIAAVAICLQTVIPTAAEQEGENHTEYGLGTLEESVWWVIDGEDTDIGSCCPELLASQILIPVIIANSPGDEALKVGLHLRKKAAPQVEQLMNAISSTPELLIAEACCITVKYSPFNRPSQHLTALPAVRFPGIAVYQ